MKAPQAIAPEVMRKAAEAACWRMVALLFSYPEGGWREQVERLAPEVDNGRLRTAAQAAVAQASEGGYTALFGPGGTARIRQAAHHQGVDLGGFMAEFAAYHAAFGYEQGGEEPPDHFAVQADFLAYLKLKEGYALANGDEKAAGVTREAAAQFAAAHVAPMALALAQALGAEAPEYLSLAAREAAAMAGPPAVPGSAGRLSLDPASEESVFSCGAAPERDELIQLEP